jgi:hypothetical protein
VELVEAEVTVETNFVPPELQAQMRDFLDAE